MARPFLLASLLLLPSSLWAQETESTPLPPPDAAAAEPDAAPLPPPELAQPLPPETAWPPPGPLTQPWPDHEAQTLTLVRGGFAVCNAATLPLRLIPTVGGLISMGIEWLCVLPTTVAVDYVQRAHGTRQSFIWQPLMGLIVMKLWRDFTQLPGLLNLLALTTGFTLGTLAAALFTVVAVTVAVVSPKAPSSARWVPAALAWLPVLFSGALAYSAFAFLVLELLRDAVGEKLFLWTYQLLAHDFPDHATQWKEQRKDYVRPRLNVLERSWLLMTVAAGTNPEFRWVHLVPILGPAVKAWDRHKALKSNIRRLAEDDLRQPNHDFELTDFSIVAVCALEGAVGVLAHVATALSLGLFVVSFAAGGVQTIPRFQSAAASGLAASAGVLAASAGVVALFLVWLREAPLALKPVVIPLAFGAWPPLGFFPDRE